MSSGLFVNAIINRGTGPIAGANQGLFASRPPTGSAPGDWYLALDTKILYVWTGSAWVVGLNGSGGGGGGTLQTVTVAGNTTDQHILLQTAGTTEIDLDPAGVITIGGRTSILINASTIQVTNASHTLTISVNTLSASRAVVFRDLGGIVAYLSDIASAIAASTLQTVTTAGNTTTNNLIVVNGFGDSVNVAASFVQLIRTGGSIQLAAANTLSGGRTATFRDLSGTVAYLTDITAIGVGINSGQFTSVTFSGATININHGLGAFPTYAGITAFNAVTAAALAPGYSITYGAGAFTVTLITPVAVAINLVINWIAKL